MTPILPRRSLSSRHGHTFRWRTLIALLLGAGGLAAGLETRPALAGPPVPENEGPCVPYNQTYTTDADFNLGSLGGVVTNTNQLELSSTPVTWPYAWVANAGEGTISKVDTQTGNEVARYYTGPPDNNANPYQYLQPSRTVVDKDGNCWVTNRSWSPNPASATQVALTGGIDWNNNSIIDTSTDTNLNGRIDPWEILPWGQDERVIRHYRIGPAGDAIRGTTLDKMGFLWCGLSGAQQVVKVSTTLPTATYSANNPPTAAPILATVNVNDLPYGLALSPDGMIYMSTSGPKAYEIDPGVASGGTGAGPAVTETINHGGQNYGLAVDKNCIVWLAMISMPNWGDFGCVRWDPSLTGGNPALGWTYSGIGAPFVGRGICVDFNNFIWMACDDSMNSVVKFSNTPVPAVLGVYPTAAYLPIGVGTASDGNIIVTPGVDTTWAKVNSVTGAVMSLPGPQRIGAGPYTYSDFTGGQVSISGNQQGTWTVITDGGNSQLAWNFISWNGQTPGGTAITVEARAAQTLIQLNSQNWTPIGSPGIQAPMPGRYLETRVRLLRFVEGCATPFVTPVLEDLTVGAFCNVCGFADCPPDTTIPCLTPTGAEFFYTPPTLKAVCDSTWTVTCSPGGGFFPIGTTPVICTAVNASDDTVTCQFNVTVTGGCDPPATGACCVNNFCSTTSEANCLAAGGIYFGDNTLCTNGCNRDCATPPNNLLAWWPLNGAAGVTTPNLAGPLTGGTLVNAPAPLAGQKVVNAYSFNGSNQYINVPHHATLNIGTSNFTLDAWVKTDQAGGVTTILDKRDPVSVQGIAFFLYDGYPSLQMAVGNAWSNFILTNANGGPPAFVADDQWHLVAVTVERNNPSGVRFYVDGSAVGTAFNPVPRAGNLNNTEPVYIARRHPGLGDGYFHGSLDEIEITRRALSADEINALWTAGAAGKCPETCYASQSVPCCNGLSANSAITICNYSTSPHTYSWGVTPLTGGAGCGSVGPTSFSPVGGTVVVPAQGCVTVPLSVACPSNIPIGQLACYQVSIFNHDTGSLFGCQGSVRRTNKWCWRNIELDPVVVGIIEILPGTGTARTLQFEVTNEGESPAAETMNYMVRPLAGDTGLPSEAVRLNGLPPGEPYIGSLDLHGGETGNVTLDVSYDDPWLIGYDRLAIYGDDDNDGTLEVLSEVAVRSVMPGTSGVPEGPAPDPQAGADPGRLFLAFPNPFNATDQIRFQVPAGPPARTKLTLYDLQGRIVRVFYHDQYLPAGDYNVPFDTRNSSGDKLKTGIYFLKLEINKRVDTTKIMVR